MKKIYTIFLIFSVFIIFFAALTYAESGVIVLLNNGKKYFIPSDNIDHIEFTYERNDNEDQTNSTNFHVNTNINFNYKYHLQNGEAGVDDWFDAQVGTVCLYIFNDKDEYLFQRDIINSGDADLINKSITFTKDELRPGETYKLGVFALGNKKGYNNSLLSPGYRLLNNMVPFSSKIEDFILKIDSDKDESGNSIVNYKKYFFGNDSKLDTLWTTQSENIISVTIPQLSSSPGLPEEEITLNIDLPLMRITNSIKINLISDTFDKETDVEDYEFVMEFPQGNDLIGLAGNLTPNGGVVYYPLRKAIKTYTPKSSMGIYDSEKENGGFFKYEENLDTDAGRYSLSSDFGLSRLMSNDKSVLKIIKKSSGQIICMLEDFSARLADYFNTSFTSQEFLDREYDFSIDLQIDNQENLVMMQAGCEGLGWGKRVYYYDIQ